MAERSRSQKTDIPQSSWLAAAAGLVLVVSTAGFMLYRAFAVNSSPPEFVIVSEAVVHGANGYHVPIRVLNRGGSVAGDLVVEGMLKQKGGTVTVETNAITIDCVPSGSQRRAGLIFSRDPRNYDLQILAKSYVQP